MAQMRDASFNPSSPHSSSVGADSYIHEDTPDTRLTVFSPHDSSAKSNKLLTGLSLDGHSDCAVQYQVNQAERFGNTSAAPEKDPFVSSTTVKAEHKLSPTASAFRPVSAPLVAHGSLTVPTGINTGVGANRQLFAPQNASKFSYELGISRCLVVYSPSHPVTIEDVETYLAKLERLGSPFQGKRHAIAVDGRVFLHLPNVRDSRNTHDNIQIGSPDWCAQYIAAAEFYKARVCGPSTQTTPICDGKVQITAYDQGVNFSAVHVETVVHTFLDTQGEVFALLRQSAANDRTFRGVVEFSDADVAISVVQKFNRATLGGVHLILTICPPGPATPAPRPFEENKRPFNASRGSVHNMANDFLGVDFSEVSQHDTGPFVSAPHGHSPAEMQAPQQFPMYPAVYNDMKSPGPNRFILDQTPTRGQGVGHMPPMTPISGGMPMMASLFNTTPPDTPMAMRGEFTSPRSIQSYGRLDSRRQGSVRANRSPYFNASHHNHVDVNRIRDGIDVRTTIMLRNIPNKVDQAMLKSIIDESSWGKYDFMYLRIDFANDCNSSMHVATSAGIALRATRSPKSPMLLYYTINGPRPELAGQEEPFPGPDNHSKMRRSCENAEHVGLFTPNAGQHFRDEQRRRRSQYDRGTRLAALEEYDYDLRAQQHGLLSQQ
ncbi:hypothetical protein P885DRAFT_25717 [Corynascus similis CBS 632.67]